MLLGDELDSPRGRIYLMKEMLERDRDAPQEVARHVDRCLMTTCPSGVHYTHLVDHGRHYIETHYKRPARERSLRRLLGTALPRPGFTGRSVSGRQAARFPAEGGPRRTRVTLRTGCAQQVLAPKIDEATVRLPTRHGCKVVVADDACCRVGDEPETHLCCGRASPTIRCNRNRRAAPGAQCREHRG